jgi:aspartate aminotransferase
LRYASRVGDLRPSATMAAAAAVQAAIRRGEDIIRFDIGEPDFDTPDHIREAGIDAIRRGFTHYTSARGIPELGDALVQSLRGDGIDVEPGNLAFYPGSKLGVYSLLSLLVGEGDEALVQDPVWPTYASIVEYLGGSPSLVRAWDEDNPEGFPVERFVEKMTPKTKAVVVNSPCNPTGSVATKRALEELAEACSSRDIVLVLDRIYSAITYDGEREKAPAVDFENGSFAVVSGFSKEFAMTGWRLGYTVTSKEINDLLVKVIDNTATCASAFVQKAAVAGLTGERLWQKKMNDEYRARRDLMLAEIAKVPGWSCVKPAGAFYCFANIGRPDSVALSDALLREAKVSSVAGAHFGPSGEGYIRLSYTTSRDRILEGMGRIRQFAESWAT